MNPFKGRLQNPLLTLLSILAVVGIVLVYSAFQRPAFVGIWELVSAEIHSAQSGIVPVTVEPITSHQVVTYELNQDGTMGGGFWPGIALSETYWHWHIFGPLLIVYNPDRPSSRIVYRRRIFGDTLFLSGVGPVRCYCHFVHFTFEFRRVTD